MKQKLMLTNGKKLAVSAVVVLAVSVLASGASASVPNGEAAKGQAFSSQLEINSSSSSPESKLTLRTAMTPVYQEMIAKTVRITNQMLENIPETAPETVPDPDISPLDAQNLPADWATNAEVDYKAKILALENDILNGKSDAKIAYLTFDDGPYNQTDGVLSVLDQYHIKATFFLLGKPWQAERYQAITAKGHAVANHTYGHDILNGLYASPQSFMNDVIKQEKFLKEQTGITTNFVRFPGGSPTAKGNKDTIIKLLRERGYGYVDWTAASGDGVEKNLTAEKAYSNTMQTVGNQKISVILMHDYNSASRSALPKIIEGLRAKGYTLLPLIKESSAVKK